MRHKHDPVLNSRVREALANPRTAQELTDFGLFLDGAPREVREIRYRAEDIREQDAPAMVLEATLPGSHSPNLEGKSAVVDVYVDDIPFREFTGTVRHVEPTDDGDTQIEAYSGGEWLASDEIGVETEWGGVSPMAAAYALLGDERFVSIDLSGIPKDAPLLYREDEDAFEEGAKKAELLADIRSQSGAIIYADPDNVCRGTTLTQLGTPKETNISYQGGVHFQSKGGFKATPSLEGRYAAVVVFRQKPEGGREVLKRLEVDNRGIYVPPGVIYPIEVTEPGVNAQTTAIAQGLQVARALSYGAFSGELNVLQCDPRVVRLDTVEVSEVKLEGRFEVERRWLLITSGYSRDPKNKTMSLLGTALKVYERYEAISREAPHGWGPDGVTWDDGRTFESLGEYTFEEIT